ncbi:conjugal transfer protein TrbL family protein [Amycolatopsis orientalis]|uniref:conjugal transfer protein TrbL family protein n=1 Tax=Amycolatopsis orientalis TaxID=31958 RepID=UPI0003AA3582|nr:conjugal transfer protein TrbL family protein [Amycolatopsis orientalis]
MQPPPIVVDPAHPVAPPPPPQQQGPQPQSGSTDCGWLDVVCKAGQAINKWFTNLVTSAMDPVLDLVGRTSMTTPDLAGNPQISQLWDITRWVANSLFILFVVVGGIVVASHETLQTRVTLKETLPRIVVGFIAVNASLSLIGLAITFVNGIATGILAGDSSGGITSGVKDEIHRQLEQGGIFMILVALVVLILAVVLLALYVLRLTITIVIVVAGPLALVCHASPYTEGIAKLWWRALFGVLAIQILQAITLIVFVKVFFVQGTSGPGNSDLLGVSGGLMNLVISCVLLFILIKIPSWVMQQVGLGGRSTIASIVKYALLAKGLGMLGVGKGAGAAAARGRSGRRGSGGAPARPRGRGPAPGPRPGGAAPRRRPGAAVGSGAQRLAHGAARAARQRAAQAWAAPARMARDARDRKQPLSDGGFTPTSGAYVPAPMSTTPTVASVAPPIESTRWGSPDSRRRSATAGTRSPGSSRAPRPATASQARDRTMPRAQARSTGPAPAARRNPSPHVHAPTFQAPGAAPSTPSAGGRGARAGNGAGAVRQPGAPRAAAKPTPRNPKKGGR